MNSRRVATEIISEHAKIRTLSRNPRIEYKVSLPIAFDLLQGKYRSNHSGIRSYTNFLSCFKMAKSRPSGRNKKAKSSTQDAQLHNINTPSKPKNQQSSALHEKTLIREASEHLVRSNPESALKCATQVVANIDSRLRRQAAGDRLNIDFGWDNRPENATAYQALHIIAQANLELGNIDSAREYFLKCVEADPHGTAPEDWGGGPEKFFILGQLCEEGGRESLSWFERGCEILRKNISRYRSCLETVDADGFAPVAGYLPLLQEGCQKLSEALCSMTELWMTDLSFEDEVEEQCEKLITEAMLIAPDSPEVLQTLASVRISQLRVEEAKGALKSSMEVWSALPPDDGKVPQFATRISLARLLMEVEMLDEAMIVLERLISEDDESVEACYLGGWCLFLSGEKARELEKKEDQGQQGDEQAGNGWKAVLESSREWLKNSLKLYELLEYEDDRLQDHAWELVENLNGQLGPLDEADGEDAPEFKEEDSDWEDEKLRSPNDDHEMAEA